MGISKSSIDKFFRLFYTTKPIGYKTDLGLSLRNDIIKAHSEELKRETEGAGAAFGIVLPNTKPGTV